MNARGAHVYIAVIGAVVGALLTGLVLPMTIDPASDQPVVAEAGGAVGGTSGAASDAVPGAALDADASGEVAAEAGLGGGAGGTTPPSPDGAAAPTESSASVPSAGAARTSREVGVSDTEIRVGVLLFDTGSAGDIGFGVPGSSPKEQQQWYEAFIGEINDGGGIHGRKIVPTFESYDVLDLEDQRRACVAIAEDVKPFIVFGYAFSNDPALCVTERYQIPLLGWLSVPDESYRQSQGRWITTSMSSTAMARTLVRRSHDQGRLRGGTIGVLMNDAADSVLSAERGAIPELKALGYDIAHSATLATDLPTAQSQIPVAISEMRRKGVDRIVSVASGVHMGLWWNQAEGQRYQPLYLLSDVQAAGGDFGGQAAPQTIRAVAYTSYRHNEHLAALPEQPESTRCRELVQKRAGSSIDRAKNPTAYANMVQHCGVVQLFARAVEGAGPALTRPALLAGVANAGRFASPGFGGSISFGPTKPDGADFVRTKEYRRDCRCFAPIDEFTQSR